MKLGGKLRWEYSALCIQQENGKSGCLDANTNRRRMALNENVALKLFIATWLNIHIYTIKVVVLAILVLVKVILTWNINTNVNSINIMWKSMQKIKNYLFLSAWL